MILRFTPARIACCLLFALAVSASFAVSPKLAIQSGHEGSLDFIATATNATLAATASASGQVSIWDVASQRKLYSATPITAKRTELVDLYIAGRNNNTIALVTTGGIYSFDISSPETVQKTAQRNLSACTLSPDGTTIYYAATQFGKVVINSLDIDSNTVTPIISHKPEAPIKIDRNTSIAAITLSEDQSIARLETSPNPQTFFYDLKSQWPLANEAPPLNFSDAPSALVSAQGRVIDAATLPNGQTALAIVEDASSERSVQTIQLADGSSQAWNTDSFKAICLRTLPHGNGFLVLGEDGFHSIQITDHDTRVRFHPVNGLVDALALSATDDIAYLTYANKTATLHFLSLAASTPHTSIPLEIGHVLAHMPVNAQLVTSPDARLLAVVSTNRVNLIEIKTAELQHSLEFDKHFQVENPRTQGAALSPDNTHIFLTTTDGLMKLQFSTGWTWISSHAPYLYLRENVYEAETNYYTIKGIHSRSAQLFRDIVEDSQAAPVVNAPPRPLIADWSSDGTFIAMRGSQSIELFDISVTDPKRIAELPIGDATIQDLALSSNGELCAVLNQNGSLSIWNQTSQEALGELILSKQSSDWIFATADGYFEGSQLGVSKAEFIIGKTLVPTTSFFETFHAPRLLSRMIQGYRPPSLADALAQFKQPPSITRIEIQDTTGNALNASAPVTEGTISLRVFAESSAATIKEIRLYHNEKLISNKTRGLFVEDDDTTTALSEGFTVALLPGRNEFKAVALNAARIESAPKSLSITHQANFDHVTGINLHIILVGIDEYTNPKYNLNYAVADATAVSDLLQSKSESIYSNVYTYSLTNQDANRENILNVIDEVKTKSGPRDTFIFYYAGHGVVSEDATFYLVPTDVTQLYGADDALAANGIASETLFAASRDIPAQKQLFILDACQSAGALAGLGQRGAAEEKAIAQLARSTGTHWLTASGSQQFATEFADLGHGAFTYTLLNGLSGKADTGDGRVTVNELKAYLESTVPEVTAKYKGTAQYPASYGYGQDFPISLP